MRATRLAAVGIATGTLVLGMAGPAFATPAEPVTPGAFCAEDAIGRQAKTATGELMECVKEAGEERARWRAADPGDDRPGDKPGDGQPGDGQPGDKPGEPPVPAQPKPQFRFGYDKVQLSSLRVAPGYKTTFTVTCPTAVTVTGNGYTQNPLPVQQAGEGRWTATGTFRADLPNPTTATVVCKDHGSVMYSTVPAKDGGSGGGKGGGTMKPRQPKIPTGRIDTGDGSTYGQGGGSAAPALAAAWGAFAVLGLGAVTLRRRTVRERS